METKIVQDLYKNEFFLGEPLNLYGLIFEFTDDEGNKKLLTPSECYSLTDDDFTTVGEKHLYFAPTKELCKQGYGCSIKITIKDKTPAIQPYAACSCNSTARFTIVCQVCAGSADGGGGTCSGCSYTNSRCSYNCTSSGTQCTTSCTSDLSQCTSSCTSQNSRCSYTCTSSGDDCTSSCTSQNSRCSYTCESSGSQCTSSCAYQNSRCAYTCTSSGTSCSTSCGNSGHSSCGSCPSSGTSASEQDINVIYENEANGQRCEILNLTDVNYNNTSYKVGQYVYQSNNKGHNSSTASMQSKEYQVSSSATLKFKWMCNAESYDKGKMEVWKDGAEQTSLEKTISGSTGSTSFQSVSVTLSTAGKYCIKFFFTKDSSNSYASDALFVKDVYIDDKFLEFVDNSAEEYGFLIMIKKL